MDARIRLALEALGLSNERIDQLAVLVDSVKFRARTEGMVTRKTAPPVTKPKPRRTIYVTYRPKGMGPTVADEIATIEGRLSRDIPQWQRSGLEARLNGLRLSGKTYTEAASETLANIAGASK